MHWRSASVLQMNRVNSQVLQLWCDINVMILSLLREQAQFIQMWSPVLDSIAPKNAKLAADVFAGEHVLFHFKNVITKKTFDAAVEIGEITMTAVFVDPINKGIKTVLKFSSDVVTALKDKKKVLTFDLMKVKLNDDSDDLQVYALWPKDHFKQMTSAKIQQVANQGDG